MKYPEHEKLHENAHENQILSEFCEFLQNRCYLDKSDFEIEQIVAEFWGINFKAFLLEKKEMERRLTTLQSEKGADI